MAKMSPDAVLAAIQSAETMALGPESSEIASDRADAIDRYLGKPYGDEQTGRSQVISRDVSDVVEGVLANVLKPFVAGDQVVRFDPRGPEDEDAAEQETDYVNFVALERNNGFLVLNSAIKDALLLRNGYVKAGWTIRNDIVIETYQGLSDDELAMLTQDSDVEIVEQQEYPDPAAQMMAPQAPGGLPTASVPGGGMPPPMLYDVKVRRVRPTEYVEIAPCPPDEIRVSRRCTTPGLQDCDFVQHRTHLTLSELRQSGYKVADDLGDGEDAANSIEATERERFGSGTELWMDPTADNSRRLVLFKESYIRLDEDGDGVAELRKICSVGQTILADEEADLIPIACFSSVAMPHKHLGISVYDLVKDLAQIKTVVFRQFLDNLYLSNNAEKIVNIDATPVLDDFLTSRPGGIKRVSGDPNAAVVPLVTPYIGQGALQGLEYLDSVRENRTGYTKASQGLDSDSLATQTATGYMAQVNQSQMRLEMISRTIAETGVRDLFRIIHALTLKHARKAEVVRLRNKWVTVDPREWVRRTDLSISVGLGSSTGQQQIQNLMLIGQAQQQAMPLGIVTPKNIYETLSKLAVAAGFKNPEAFFTAPPEKPRIDPQTGQPQIGPDGKPIMDPVQPPQQPPPEVQAAQIAAQGLQQQEQIKQQSQQQIEKYKTDVDSQTRYRIAMLNAGKDMLVQANKHSADLQHNMAQLHQKAMQMHHDSMQSPPVVNG